MGLCINWTLRAPENASVESVTASMRAFADAECEPMNCFLVRGYSGSIVDTLSMI
jgi:hypothetical protein